MISMSEFFELAEVKRLQSIQRSYPFGSEQHRRAFELLKALASASGVDAEKFFGDYDE